MPIKSPRAKGNRNRNKSRLLYESDGWVIDVVEKTSKWVVEKDLFSSTGAGFDLIGLKRNTIVLIQVKTNRIPKLDSYIEFAKKYAGTNLLIHINVWFDRAGCVVKTIDSSGIIFTNDLRKRKQNGNG